MYVMKDAFITSQTQHNKCLLLLASDARDACRATLSLHSATEHLYKFRSEIIAPNGEGGEDIHCVLACHKTVRCT